jgi:hypothetical protein
LYAWTASKGVVEAFLHFDEDQRAQLLNTFDMLAQNPFEQSDIVLPGETSDPFCEIKLMEELVVSFYVDHAAKEVRILSIDRV